MARARNIKPGILENELLGEADPIMTLAFVGLWMIADKEGRLEDRPKRIRAQLFPYRSDIDMDMILDWLKVNSFISRYQSNVGPIISIVKWSKHQRPHHKEKDSVLPAESPESSGSEQDQSNVEPSMTQAQAKNDPSITLVGQPNPPDTGYRIPDTGLSDTGSSDTQATKLSTPSEYLDRLKTVHGFELMPNDKLPMIEQAKQWVTDNVTIDEFDDAVRKSKEQFSRKGDRRDPGAKYIATIVKGDRDARKPIKAGAPPINTHGGFTPDRYAIDETALKFKQAGGAA